MADSYVYTGFWVNWARGPVLGTTLTTTNEHGTFLVAFLALWVRMVGSNVWGIICFIIHQLKSSSAPRDGLHHQHQLILRNSQSPTSTVWDLTKIAFYWRSNAKRGILRTIPLIVFTIFHVAAFTAAGLFSSRIASTSDEVLIQSPYCGYMKVPNATAGMNASGYEEMAADFVRRRSLASWSSTYARNCYLQNDAPSSTCNVFPKSQLNFTYEFVSCPFDRSMCLDPDSGAIQISTGIINSNLDLGINSKKKDSVDYRRITTCAPLVSEGFTKWNPGNSFAIPGDQFLDFFYGEQLTDYGNFPWTYAYDKYQANETSKAYFLSYNWAGLDDISSDFVPITQLRQASADLTLIFLTNFAAYPLPVTDLMFNAQVPSSGLGNDTVVYRAAQPVAPMACTEQHQFCDPNTGKCSPFTGATVLGNMKEFSGVQLSVVRHVFQAIDSNFLNNMVFDLGDKALLAELQVDGAQVQFSGQLPDNQWSTEVLGWHSYMMAHLQRQMYDFAAGPADPSYNIYVQPPEADDQARFNVCMNQKIRDSRYYSINVLGLATTVIIGALIVIVNLSLSTTVGAVQRITGRGAHQYQDWNLDHDLQVQRMAYENAGLGRWRGEHALVPVTDLGDRFGKPTRVTLVRADATPADSSIFRGFTSYQPYAPIPQHDAYGLPKLEHYIGVSVRETDPSIRSGRGSV